jgi:hypothetical protein
MVELLRSMRNRLVVIRIGEGKADIGLLPSQGTTRYGLPHVLAALVADLGFSAGTVVAALILGRLGLLEVDAAVATVLRDLQHGYVEGECVLILSDAIGLEDLVHEVHLGSPLAVTLLFHVNLGP